jgi:hypothetical protein
VPALQAQALDSNPNTFKKKRKELIMPPIGYCLSIASFLPNKNTRGGKPVTQRFQ